MFKFKPRLHQKILFFFLLAQCILILPQLKAESSFNFPGPPEDLPSVPDNNSIYGDDSNGDDTTPVIPGPNISLLLTVVAITAMIGAHRFKRKST